MKYSLGVGLADFGFAFLEKIHEPIFLINRLGKVVKINEAGRKLMSVTKTNLRELETFGGQLGNLFKSPETGYKRMKLSGNLSVIARNLRDSDFILVEVTR